MSIENDFLCVYPVFFFLVKFMQRKHFAGFIVRKYPGFYVMRSVFLPVDSEMMFRWIGFTALELKQ